jgi:5-amino-6-(5-phosphoribosylamino)uracil reductase/diaminohydroxyphosphoribosylaminopyrimidine deaminase/5-amino-6-(5-phosphoribosylamino)uracil reductase
VHGETGRPRITLKIAQSLDGRIATATGHSRWVTGTKSRTAGHALRAEHDAILVGIGTVLADDPELTVRLVQGRHPTRVVLDTTLRLPLDAAVVRDRSALTVAITTPRAPRERIRTLEAAGVRVETVNAVGGHVDLSLALRVLRGLGIESLLVEGGAAVATDALRRRLVDRIAVFIAPKVIGRGLDAVGDLGTLTMDEAIVFTDSAVELLDGDIFFRGVPVWPDTRGGP